MRNKMPGEKVRQCTSILGGGKFLTGPASRHDGKSDPAEELEEIVWK